ncbi:MAG TPA: hypothetical protein VGS27_01805 [Candidatus Sulfotelmatobacter sp.]|nr:hypothetical protein [Candidatus Sulfotelmatobacter sp.]
MADTPAPGKIHLVKAGENLQAALDSANCGDTVALAEGASFEGHVRLPKKSCDDKHWILIRTSAPDEELPPEGTRISPCYAGIASLPGRPDFHCTSPRNVMAKITFAGRGGSGPIFFSAGANHYRLIGIEITREPTGARVTALAGPDGPVPADHIFFDRVWFHGTARDETTRGLFLARTTYMAVVDSYFSDFHCNQGGACTDSQAVSGAAGDLPMGPYKIVNNYLEAAGENIILGGAAATMTPADIEIRHNYFYKPIIWMLGQPGFVGGASGKPFVVKNLFELKNAQRVLFEGNVLENTWGGFSQQGFAILLTPKNQSPNICPLCRVTDITIRYNKISHVAGGMQIANVRSDTGGASSGGERYSIHDLLFDDIDGQAYKGLGVFLMLISNTPALRDVSIDHVTAFPSRVLLNIGGFDDRFPRFSLTNSLLSAGERQITSTGGGMANCSFQPERQGPAGILENCFPSGRITHNAIIGGFGWPSGNFTPKDFNAAGVVELQKGRGGAYHLCQSKGEVAGCKSASQSNRAGTDGKDIGADLAAIEEATRGVI